MKNKNKTDDMTTATVAQNDKETQNIVDELTAAISINQSGNRNKQSTRQDEIIAHITTDTTDEKSGTLEQSNVLNRIPSTWNMDNLAKASTENNDDDDRCQSEKTIEEVAENDTDNLAQAENHNKSLLSCYICNKSFCDLSSLRKHRSSHRKAGYLRCDECKFCCMTTRRLEFHKLEHKTVGIYRCEKCGKCFPTSLHLYRHDSNIHAGIKPYGCCDCEYRTYTFQSLQRHELKHKLTCPVCNEHFSQNRDLNKHMTQLHLTKPHKCSQCDASYPIRSLLIAHIATHATSAGIKSFHCTVCDKGYTSEFRLRQHIYRAHTTEKKHECKTCGERFPLKYLLTRHEVKHSEELKHVCIVCGKTYMRRDSLKSHMASHSGSKSFMCSVCGTGYFTERMLRNHMARRHADSAEERFPCDICGKAFGRNWLLKEHMVIHSSEKKFCCKICGKTFKHEKSLRDHKGKHSDDIAQQFECDKCEKKFRTQRNLREHMNHTHGPEDKRRERLQKRAQQERARQQKKRKDKVEKTSCQNSRLEPNEKGTKCFGENDADELNSLTSMQIKASEVPKIAKNQTKADDKNLSTSSTVSVDNEYEKTGNSLKDHITGESAGRQKQVDHLQDDEDMDFETFDINKVSDVMDVDDNDDYHSANGITYTYIW